jgi:hypothetical protein
MKPKDLLPTFYRGEGVIKKIALLTVTPIGLLIAGIDRFNTPAYRPASEEEEGHYNTDDIPGLTRRRPVTRSQNQK